MGRMSQCAYVSQWRVCTAVSLGDLCVCRSVYRSIYRGMWHIIGRSMGRGVCRRVHISRSMCRSMPIHVWFLGLGLKGLHQSSLYMGVRFHLVQLTDYFLLRSGFGSGLGLGFDLGFGLEPRLRCEGLG